MNIPSKFALSDLILSNIFLAHNIPYVKDELVTIQDFQYVDYTIGSGAILQLYHTPITAHSINSKKGLYHHDNRLILLCRAKIQVIDRHVNDLCKNSFDISKYQLENELMAVIKA